ncbi:MAG TPA: hypothetical protein VF469_33750, partial [Kofleriaceae bacterium]
LDALLGLLNGHITAAAGAHAATAIGYPGGGAWKDGTANPATTVKAQLDKLVGDLTADAGAARLGAGARPNWLDGRANPAGVSILAALSKIITDLSDQTANADGAARIGAGASGTLAAGSIRSQLDALSATAVRTNVANVFSATQTANGAAGDTSAALTTTNAPATRKLLWDIAGTAGVNTRIYAASRALEVTINARWDGAQWVKDSIELASAKLEFKGTELRLNSDDATASPFPDQWASSVAIGVTSHGQQSLDAGGNWVSPGATETYLGWQGSSANVTSLGAAASFRKVFPSTPSSITFAVVASQNLATAPVAIAVTATGTGAVFTASLFGFTQFYARVIAS